MGPPLIRGRKNKASEYIFALGCRSKLRRIRATPKKITIRDLFAVNRDSRHKDHESRHDFFSFSLKKEIHDSRHFVVARYMPDQGTT